MSVPTKEARTGNPRKEGADPLARLYHVLLHVNWNDGTALDAVLRPQLEEAFLFVTNPEHRNPDEVFDPHQYDFLTYVRYALYIGSGDTAAQRRFSARCLDMVGVLLLDPDNDAGVKKEILEWFGTISGLYRLARGMSQVFGWNNTTVNHYMIPDTWDRAQVLSGENEEALLIALAHAYHRLVKPTLE